MAAQANQPPVRTFRQQHVGQQPIQAGHADGRQRQVERGDAQRAEPAGSGASPAAFLDEQSQTWRHASHIVAGRISLAGGRHSAAARFRRQTTAVG